ncbi:MAG: flap endonuclease-1 [Euryarchaeota archaeon]|nr:flap endonuclease-1 [Euryarchaeota archaeon]
MGVDLGDILPRTKIELGQIDTVAIDGHNTVYQFLSIIRQRDGTPLMDSAGRTTSHLSGLFYRTTHMLEAGVRCAYVFDGEPPDLKRRTVLKRRETREHATQEWEQAKAEGRKDAFKFAQASSRVDEYILESSKCLLQYLGIPVVEAPSEGEAQAAYMTIKGDVSFTGSQDFDALLFGAPRLVRNLTITGRRKLPGRNVHISVSPELLDLEDILESLEITREQLIDVGILVGTDYNKGVKGVGPKKALKMIKQSGIEKALEELDESVDYVPIKEFFLNPNVTDNYVLEWTPIQQDRLFHFLCDEHDFSRDRVENTLQQLSEAQHNSGQRSLAQWL